MIRDMLAQGQPVEVGDMALTEAQINGIMDGTMYIDWSPTPEEQALIDWKKEKEERAALGALVVKWETATRRPPRPAVDSWRSDGGSDGEFEVHGIDKDDKIIISVVLESSDASTAENNVKAMHGIAKK